MRATLFIRRRTLLGVHLSISHVDCAIILDRLAWAREGVFSFVLYCMQRTHAKAREEVGSWACELIEPALEDEGRYYLPYQLHATKDQFERAYPEAKALRRIKEKVIPDGKCF